jgi:hypothetical protein
VVLQNLAVGGDGTLGGDGGSGQGGGIEVLYFGNLTLTGSMVVTNEADGGAADEGGSVGQGQGGGLYISGTTTAHADQDTVILLNHASTSDDDVFGDLIQL